MSKKRSGPENDPENFRITMGIVNIKIKIEILNYFFPNYLYLIPIS